MTAGELVAALDEHSQFISAIEHMRGYLGKLCQKSGGLIEVQNPIQNITVGRTVLEEIRRQLLEMGDRYREARIKLESAAVVIQPVVVEATPSTPAQ